MDRTGKRAGQLTVEALVSNATSLATDAARLAGDIGDVVRKHRLETIAMTLGYELADIRSAIATGKN